jgi:hypothetical protein
MPKFLTGCHYNVIEISQHLEKYIGYWPVQVNGNKLATGQILEKTGRSCEWADFSWWSSKVSRTLPERCAHVTKLDLGTLRFGLFLSPKIFPGHWKNLRCFLGWVCLIDLWVCLID